MNKLPLKAKIFTLILPILATILLVFLFYSNGNIVWFRVLSFAFLIILAEVVSVDLPNGGAISIAFALEFALIIIGGPLEAALASLFTAIAWRDLKTGFSKIPWPKVFLNASQFVLSVGTAGLVYVYTGGILGWPVFSNLSQNIFPLFLSALTYYVLNTFLFSIFYALKDDSSLIRVWYKNISFYSIPFYALLAILGVIFARVYIQLNNLSILLMVVSLLIANESFRVHLNTELPGKLKKFIIVTYFIAAGLLLFFTLNIGDITLVPILLFCFITFLAESLKISLPKGAAISISFCIMYAAILVFGPVGGVLTALATAFNYDDIKIKLSLYKILFNGSNFVISAGFAGLIYQYTGGIVLLSSGRSFIFSDFPLLFVPLFAAALTFFVFNSGLVSFFVAYLHNLSPLNTWLFNFKWLTPNYFSLGVLGIILAQVYVITGTPGIILIVVPLLVAREAFKVYMRLRGAYADTVQSLVTAIEAKDAYTRGHSERVAKYSEMIARQMKLAEDKIELIKYAALLHDVGKIGVSKRILCKPNQLSQEEYKKVKEHPDLGAVILKDVEFLKAVMPGVQYHHEHFDGSGYGNGLGGSAIPLVARIMAVADAFDAMTSARPYRKAMAHLDAAKELHVCAGTQFDADVVDALVVALDIKEKLMSCFDKEGDISLEKG